MGKPRMIILIRHAQSEGNKNRDIHQTVPDHRVELTQDGWKQATEAGVKLRSLLHPTDTLHFFTSPYRRTRETTEGILNALTSNDPTPSSFPRSAIKVYEEPRLREQDFGNYQPSSAEMSAMWQERARYGHFFYRIPNGESAADAYDRISGFNESLWRSFGEENFASVCVLVTHGLMTRVFLMKWYHFSVEYFEDLRNVNHCEFVVMKLNQETGKFALQNQLRTWSGLRQEKAEVVAQPESPIPVRKRWGDYSEQDAGGFGRRQLARRQNTADLFADDIEVPGCASTVQQEDWAMKLKHSKSASRDKRAISDASSRYSMDWTGSKNATATREAGGSGVKASMARSRNNSSTILERSPDRNDVGLDAGGGGSGSGSSEDEDSEVRKRLRALPTRNSMALALHGDLLRNPDIAAATVASVGRASVGRASFSSETAEPRADALGDQSDVDDDLVIDGVNVDGRGGRGGGVGSGVEGEYVRNENVA